MRKNKGIRSKRKLEEMYKKIIEEDLKEHIKEK